MTRSEVLWSFGVLGLVNLAVVLAAPAGAGVLLSSAAALLSLFVWLRAYLQPEDGRLL